MPEHRVRGIANGDGYIETDSGILLPPWAYSLIEPKLPTAVDLFAGAGGFSCGLHQAGFHVIGASEWWPVAVQTYLCNLGSPDTIVHVGTTPAPDATAKERKLFAEYGGQAVPASIIFPVREEPIPAGFTTQAEPGATRLIGPGTGWILRPDRDHERGSCCPESIGFEDEDGAGAWCDLRHGEIAHHEPCEHLWMCDVAELDGRTMLEQLGLDELDLVVGGPPCQGFSRANVKASKDDPRNLLVFEFARLVCEMRPRAMCMENVPAIVSMTTPEGIPVIDALARILEDGGMGSYEALRKSILSTAGLGAAVRGAGKGAKNQPVGVDEEELEELGEQLALEVA